MSDSDLVAKYNYDSFVPDKFQPWLNFAASPPIGRIVRDFPLWNLDETETSLHTALSGHSYTIVEFGSFT